MAVSKQSEAEEIEAEQAGQQPHPGHTVLVEVPPVIEDDNHHDHADNHLEHLRRHHNHPNHQTSNNSAMEQNCCASCQMPIKDRFIFNVVERNFHQECVRCADCSAPLSEKCFTFDGKLFCRLDYWRRFGPKCRACSEPIKPTELVQRLKENIVYHLSCFVCQDCKRHLQAGEQLHLIDGRRLLCTRDFLNINSKQTTGSIAITDNNNHMTVGHQHITQFNQRNTAGNFKNLAGGIVTSPNSTTNSSHQDPDQNLKQDDTAAATTALTTTATNEDHQMTGLMPIRRQQRQFPEDEQDCADMEELEGMDEENDEDEVEDEDDDADSQMGDHLAGDLQHLSSQTALFGTGRQTKVTGSKNSKAANVKSGHENIAGGGAKRASLQGATNISGNNNNNNLIDCGDDLVDANGKRRGPRTTIKPKQLETLRRAFESAPKPSRHIREQLATETGLNMRVIQVWFQNRRSKERRMKNSNGSMRRNFFRSTSRRLRLSANQQQQQQQPAAGAANSTSSSSSTTTTSSGAGQQQQQQQSLMANSPQAAAGRPSANKLLKSAEATDQTHDGQAKGEANMRQRNSPADFGASSFTYFSDSSNQGDAFAINQTAQSAAQQQQFISSQISSNGDAAANLMALGPQSPAVGMVDSGLKSGAAQRRTPSSLKDTPTPPGSIYPAGGHMMLSNGRPQQQQLGPGNMMPTDDGHHHFAQQQQQHLHLPMQQQQQQPPAPSPQQQQQQQLSHGSPHLQPPHLHHQHHHLHNHHPHLHHHPHHHAHHHHQQQHLVTSQMVPQAPNTLPIGGLIGAHPQGPPSVVQW